MCMCSHGPHHSSIEAIPQLQAKAIEWMAKVICTQCGRAVWKEIEKNKAQRGAGAGEGRALESS